MLTQVAVSKTQPSIQIILWEDIFVVIDDGSGSPLDYEELHRLIVEQSALYVSGLGCLAIIPANAKPPSEAVRKALNTTLGAVPLRCICWCVEGSGFQGAMVRGVLTGLRFLGRRSYPTHVTGDLEEALRWMLSNLEGGDRRAKSAPLAAQMIRSKRKIGFLRSI